MGKETNEEAFVKGFNAGYKKACEEVINMFMGRTHQMSSQLFSMSRREFSMTDIKKPWE